MNSFRFNVQTAMYFGRNTVREHASFFKAYGSRAVIFTTVFPEGHPNQGLVDLEDVFKAEGIEYLVLDEVEIDPPVDTVVKLSRRAAEFKADFFVAVGGGSSIDTSKAVAVLLDHPEESDPYKVFYTPVDPALNIRSQCSMPIFGIPTTAGTGAEVSPFAVLTRADIHTKLAMFPYVYCTAAFLDPRYIETAPASILHTGVFDALAHGVESYLHNSHNVLNRQFAEKGFELFRSFKDRLRDGGLTEEDYDAITLHSYLQGLAFSSTDSCTTIPHGMGYPLSHIKHVNHGNSCAIFLAEYVRGFKDQSLVQPIVEMCGFKNSDEFAEYCQSIIETHVNIEVTDAELQQWTDDFMKTGHTASNPEPLTHDDILELYRRALKKYITA